MRITKLSPKQGQVFDFILSDEYALICDGAVRSGKTISMIVAFMMWAMDNFNNTNFAICGKTAQSTERILLKPLQQVEGLPYTLRYKISTKTLIVNNANKTNTFYFYGGKDESSYELIQGLTLAGILFDEVALMPRSFVEQAIARTLSYANAKLWFNCNPDSPKHWFYQEWIKEPKPGTKHINFLMSDNPILTEKEIQKAENMFRGVFYDKYIRGLWKRAEGIIFGDFADNPQNYVIKKDEIPKRFRWADIGFDIGGSSSAYSLCCVAQGYDGVMYVIKSQKKQAQELPMDKVEKYVFEFLKYIESNYNFQIKSVNCDHSDVIINTLNEKRYIFGKTYKPPLEDRPFLFSILMAQGRFKLIEGECDDLIDELSELVYDDKKEKPIPLDDGSMQIDTYDSLTYACSNHWHFLNEGVRT